jgi:hypothetical protein
MISRTTLDAATKVSDHASRHLLSLVDSHAWQPAPDAALVPLHGAASTSASGSEGPDRASKPDPIPHLKATD